MDKGQALEYFHVLPCCGAAIAEMPSHMDSDSCCLVYTMLCLCRVLVMDRGQALEYGRPADLLENDEGAFTG
jgi:hypothetical protein